MKLEENKHSRELSFQLFKSFTLTIINDHFDSLNTFFNIFNRRTDFVKAIILNNKISMLSILKINLLLT